MIKTRYAGFIFIIALCGSPASAQPTFIPRRATAPHDAAKAYLIAKDYLDPMGGSCTIVRADPASHTLIAERSGIEPKDWDDWSYCKLSPDQMLDTLNNGKVKLTVSLDPAGKHSSNVAVTADFNGTYGFAGRQTTVQCVSKGGLENRVLQAVGAQPQGN
ncbi:MAG: Ig-like domain repeat protein [Deltaproteobacteria bacterium]|nr:Ig-like domain repeat protein [Deltaproteobacteria bacterium]